MPELGPSGSVRGAVSNHRPYRDQVMLRMSQAFERLAAIDQIAEQPSKKAQSRAANSQPD